MELLKLDRSMNELMEKYDYNETTEQEEEFLENLTKDLLELLFEHNKPVYQWLKEIVDN